MAEFVMPSLGADMRSGTLVEWRKQPGEAVRKGEIIAEVETDKGVIEVEAFSAGTVEQLLAGPGDHVPVGTPLAILREDGEVARPPQPAASPPAAGAPGRHPISPAAKRLAEELGIDASAIDGSGPHGRVLLRDVHGVVAARTTTTDVQVAVAPTGNGQAAAPEPTATPPPDAASRMRESIAAAMTRSKRETPHYYVRTTISMGNAVAWLAEQNERRPLAGRLLYGVLLIKAVALALREAPDLNARWQDGHVVKSERVNVGMAVSLRGGGLIAPALHDAESRSLDDLMRGFRDVVNRARNGGLRASELSDPTITVTSLGERGAEEVYGVIVPPQVAIVGVGALVERPWVFQGGLVPCPVITVTVSGDHRVSDGHRASAFLSAVDRLLQEPNDL